VPATETVCTEVNVEKEMDATDLKYLERYGELGPQVLARLGKSAHRNKLIVEQYIKHREKYGATIVFAADTLHAKTLAPVGEGCRQASQHVTSHPGRCLRRRGADRERGRGAARRG